jgi:hypothetical protein
VHNLLGAGAFICLAVYQTLVAIGGLEEKGTTKYRLVTVFALLGGLLCFASVFQFARNY